MSELLFEREKALRLAALKYAGCRSGAITDNTNIEDARKQLRAAALAYASIANEIDTACSVAPDTDTP